MQHSFLSRWRIIAPFAVVALVGAPWAAQAAAPAASATHGRVAASCAALGAYQVGPRVVPYVQSHVHATPPSARSQSHAVPIVVWPAWTLRGTLTIAAYTGCGSPTSGTFSVQRTVIGPPVEQPNRSGSIVCDVPCARQLTGIVSATGTFAQDPAHPGDATYLRVSATITSARPGPMMGRSCSPSTGCPPARVITSTVTFSDVTGYLQVNSGDRAAVPADVVQRTATLSFLPPPMATGSLTPSPVVLLGWRGSYAPQPAPRP